MTEVVIKVNRRTREEIKIYKFLHRCNTISDAIDHALDKALTERGER